MKRGLNSEVIYRGLYALTMLTASVGVVALAMSIQTPVSAGQAPAQPAAAPATTSPAASSATKDNSPTHPEFPPGEGRDAVLTLCVKCHSPNIILATGQDRIGWENTITKMVHLGATGDDEDFSDIADYLTAHFPPSSVLKVFVNMATAKQFATVLGISEDDGKAIVTYRDQVKGFNSIDDMKKVPGVDTKKIDENKDHLVFGAVAVKPPAS